MEYSILWSQNRRGHVIHLVLKNGNISDFYFKAESQRGLELEVKRLLREFYKGDGRTEEVERVYTTRIDCMVAPEGVRQAA